MREPPSVEILLYSFSFCSRLAPSLHTVVEHLRGEAACPRNLSRASHYDPTSAAHVISLLLWLPGL